VKISALPDHRFGSETNEISAWRIRSPCFAGEHLMSYTPSAGPVAPRKPALQRLARAAEPWLYSAPVLILIITVMMVPLVLGLSYAFRDVQLLNPFSGGFIGLDHFRELSQDVAFYRALKNTLWWTGASVFLQFTFGLILALLLDKPFAGRGVVQALVFLPWAVPTFLAGLNWAWLFNPVIGPLPHWMTSLGLLSAPNNILADPHLAMWGPIIANVWWGIPFFAITLLAALQAIPRDLYEAASIDGATPLQRFTSITLPFLAPTIAITVLLRTVWIANFADLIIVMTNGGPADRTQIVASYIFTQAFKRLDFGYASAIALALLVLLLAYSMVIVIMRQRLIEKD
jgi:multiple sugar transport system permease protein